jgi:hypothetical protein
MINCPICGSLTTSDRIVECADNVRIYGKTLNEIRIALEFYDLNNKVSPVA